MKCLRCNQQASIISGGNSYCEKCFEEWKKLGYFAIVGVILISLLGIILTIRERKGTNR